MTALWLPNARRHLISSRPGRRYADAVEKKMLLHTTEGTTIAGAIAAYRDYPPHLIYKPAGREVVQHIPLNLASYALRSSVSEGDGVVQLEIVGFSVNSAGRSDGWLRNLAEDVLAPVARLWPYELQAPVFYDSNGGYGEASPSRFSRTGWDEYSGLVGHQHSPGDAHWDPGPIDADKLLRFTLDALQKDGTTMTTKWDLNHLMNAMFGRLDREFPNPTGAPPDLGYSIQETNGSVKFLKDWVVPTVGRIERAVAGAKTSVEGLSGIVGRIESKLDGVASKVDRFQVPTIDLPPAELIEVDWSLSDEDVHRIAVAVVDENARRLDE